jgi:hypothetical protein
MGGETAGRALTTGRPAASLGGDGGVMEVRADAVVDGAIGGVTSGFTEAGGTGPRLANTSSGPSKRLFFFFLGLF